MNPTLIIKYNPNSPLSIENTIHYIEDVKIENILIEQNTYIDFSENSELFQEIKLNEFKYVPLHDKVNYLFKQLKIIEKKLTKNISSAILKNDYELFIQYYPLIAHAPNSFFNHSALSNLKTGKILDFLVNDKIQEKIRIRYNILREFDYPLFSIFKNSTYPNEKILFSSWFEHKSDKKISFFKQNPQYVSLLNQQEHPNTIKYVFRDLISNCKDMNEINDFAKTFLYVSIDDLMVAHKMFFYDGPLPMQSNLSSLLKTPFFLDYLLNNYSPPQSFSDAFIEKLGYIKKIEDFQQYLDILISHPGFANTIIPNLKSTPILNKFLLIYNLNKNTPINNIDNKKQKI